MSDESIDFRSQAKRRLFEEYMKEDHVLLHLDSRKDGISLPENLLSAPNVTLKLSYKFQGETICNDKHIDAYLKFSGSYFQCIIPWNTVWGMTSSGGNQKIWTEDIPKEVVVQLAKAKLSELGQKLFNRSSSAKEEQHPTTTSQSKNATKEKRPRKSTLKRVK